MSKRSGDITAFLQAWNEGDSAAEEELMRKVLPELKRLAHRYLKKERKNHTFQTSDLVNETYLRFVPQNNRSFQNRSHFFAIASIMMRRILVSYAQKNARLKRGGPQKDLQLDETIQIAGSEVDPNVLAVHEALDDLALLDKRQAKVVELRFFAGASIAEAAHVLGVSVATIKRDWQMARAWLSSRISREKDGE